MGAWEMDFNNGTRESWTAQNGGIENEQYYFVEEPPATLDADTVFGSIKMETKALSPIAITSTDLWFAWYLTADESIQFTLKIHIPGQGGPFHWGTPPYWYYQLGSGDWVKCEDDRAQPIDVQIAPGQPYWLQVFPTCDETYLNLGATMSKRKT